MSEFKDSTTPPLAPETETKKFYTALELVNMGIDVIPTLFEDYFPKVGLWGIAGESDAGKSMFLRQMAMCVAGGLPFMDLQCNATNKRAIIVSSEDDETALSWLFRQQRKSVQLSDDCIANITVIIDTEGFIEELEKQLSTTPTDLVILDAFGDLFDGKDLNQNSQVRAFLNKFSQLANRYKCSIGFLHHTGKRTEDLTPSKNNANGSQAFEAKMRMLALLKTDKFDPDLRHFCVVKGNYLSQDKKKKSTVLRMDEHFTFSDTGERVEYSKLNEGAKGKSKRNEPAELEDSAHFLCIRTILFDMKQYSQNELVRKVEHFWTIANKVARRYVDYYAKQNWIVDVSKNPSRRSYKNNLSTD